MIFTGELLFFFFSILIVFFIPRFLYKYKHWLYQDFFHSASIPVNILIRKNMKSVYNMRSIFEQLPTEIFFEIFDYLTIFDLLYALINLNKRMNGIVGLYPVKLDFQRISRSKFDWICRYIQAKQVISIYMSDEMMPKQVELFDKYFPNFQHRFTCLKKIKFNNTSTILPHLPGCLSSLTIKTYLKKKTTGPLITQILNEQAQYLTYLEVDGCYAFRYIDTSFPLLTHLTIDYCTVTELHRIILMVKSPLTHLKLLLDKEENFTLLNFAKLSETLTHLTLSFSEDILMSFDLIIQCIQQLKHLTYLTLRATGTFDLMNGELWEEYLLERKIKKFNFKFTLANNFTCDQDKYSLLQSFRSSFWLEKNRWYIACEKGKLQSSRPTIYSIPYFQSPFVFYPSNNSLPVSTNEVEILSSEFSHLMLTFHNNLPLPNVPFTHVRSLTLLSRSLPSLEILQSIVNLSQIQKFDVSSIKNLSIDDFQNIISQMINLKRIKMQYDPLFLPPLHLDSYIFVRKDQQIYVLDMNNIKRFCYLFFHIKYLEISVESQDIILQLLTQLYYLEFVKIFCYQGYSMNMNRQWLQRNVPRLNMNPFTHRATSSYILLSIGNKKLFDDRTNEETADDQPAKSGCYKFRSRCVIQ